jgi:hypothetical protein
VLVKIAIVVLALVGLLVLTMPRHSYQPQAYEMGAMRTITLIHTAEANYLSRFGRYGESLEVLIAAKELDLFREAGYHIKLSLARGGYVIEAAPVRCGETGGRSFYSDETLAIQHPCPEPAGPADAVVR